MSNNKKSLKKYISLRNQLPELFSNQDAPLEILMEENAILDWQRYEDKELEMNDRPKSWSSIGILLEDPYLLILRDLLRFPSKKLKTYTRLLNRADLNGGQGSAILPLKDGKILLLRQYRHATRKWHWEIPRGFGESNLSAEDNARKEIREEISGEIENLIDLGEYHANTGIESFSVRLFLAYILKTADVKTEEGIDHFELFSTSNIEQMIQMREITDGFTIAAYTRAKLQGLLAKSSVENKWKITQNEIIPEILNIQPPIFHDTRGYFMETFDENIFRKHNIPTHYILDHESYSRRGTIRGLHYQIKYPQGKLIRIPHGKVYTVAVDLRQSSPTFGKWAKAEISSENKKILWIPPGFAHGFFVLSEYANVVYKTTNIYAPKWERTLAWNDPYLNIKWPLLNDEYPILSEKDSNGKYFHELEHFEGG